MNSRSHLSLAGILVGLAFALGNFGCGGGEQTAAAPPAPISVSVSPASATVQAGGTQQFTATVTNDPSNKGVTWAITPATGAGTLSNLTQTSVTYNAPASLTTALNVTITATAVADSTKSSSSSIAVVSSALTVVVTPTAATVQPGTTARLTATVYNDPANAGVAWAISCAPAEPGEWGAPCGTLSPAATASGAATTYAAPTAGDLVVTITAFSATDQVAYASATVRVPGIGVAVAGGTAVVKSGTSAQFTATVYNDAANKGVTWTLLYAQNGGLVPCPPASVCGSVSPIATGSGVATTYTAPATQPAANLEVAIMATSVANNSVWAQAFITIPGPPSLISVGIDTLPGPLIQVGGTVGLTAGVTNDAYNAGVTWSLEDCTGGTSVCGSLTNINNSGPFTADYVAPAAVPPGGQVTIVATSVTNPAKSASSPITISPINFTSKNYSAGNSPDGVAGADFNGDGKLDIVVADYGNPSTGDNGGVSILLGNGDGTFKPAQFFSAGKNPISVTVGDFNNDGKQDLLVADYGDRSSGGNGNLTFLLGNGDGTFQPPITLTAGPEPFELAVGDFNNDGRLDFAVTDINSGVYVFIGNGDGTFLTPGLLSSGNNPVAIVAVDFNRDGKLDLAVAGFPPGDTGGSTVGIMLGNGDGTFAAAVDYPVSEDRGPTSLAAGDLTGDGKTDLAVTTYSCAFGLCGSVTSTMLGNGDGTFQPVQTVWFKRSLSSGLTPLSIHIADLSGNGMADLVQIAFEGGASLAVFPGNGDGTFQGTLFFTADQGPFSLALGDFNGDGKPDIVVANSQSNDITVLLNATVP